MPQDARVQRFPARAPCRHEPVHEGRESVGVVALDQVLVALGNRANLVVRARQESHEYRPISDEFQPICASARLQVLEFSVPARLKTFAIGSYPRPRSKSQKTAFPDNR